jgi:diguanylate cyclase (GGDEF)-like protein
MPTPSEILNAKILIVDDCADNAEMMQAILEQAGYTGVRVTTIPGIVCEWHAREAFDLIILDLHMPGMSGFDVMEGLKIIEHGGYLPVLALTGHADYKIRALEAGARDFLSKPFDMAEACKRIHNLLEVRLLYKELAAHSRTLADLALHDALTGLPNRRLLEDRLNNTMQAARRNHCKTCVMYLDLDGFKEINDRFGHASGDKLLQLVAKRLTGTSRAADTVARIGGDEFVVVYADLARIADIHAPARKLIESVSEVYIVNGNELHVTASIGVAVFPDHADDADALMKAADIAMYEAKRSGKNRYHLAAPKPHSLYVMRS